MKKFFAHNYERSGTRLDIHSDKWKAYLNLNQLGFIHKTVYHSEKIV